MNPADGQAAHRDKGAEEIAMRKWNADLSAVARRAKAERGMSLVEATIILMVLASLTAVIAPSAGDYVNDARQTKAKEDVEVIGNAILRVLRDTGSRCLRIAGTTGCTYANRVDILYSGGGDPLTVNTATAPDGSDDADSINAVATPNWVPDVTLATWSNEDTMDDQFVTNAAAYTGVSFTSGGGPRSGLGWRGAYSAGPITGDSWGTMFQSNTRYLAVASNASDGGGLDNTTEGLQSGGWSTDVIVMSAGANKIVETPFDDHAVTAEGDDVIFVVRGSTR